MYMLVPYGVYLYLITDAHSNFNEKTLLKLFEGMLKVYTINLEISHGALLQHSVEMELKPFPSCYL